MAGKGLMKTDQGEPGALARLGAYVGSLLTGGAITKDNLKRVAVQSGLKRNVIVEDGLTGSRIIESTEITSSLGVDVAAMVEGEINKATAEGDAIRKRADGDFVKAQAEAQAIIAGAGAKPAPAVHP